MERGDVKGFGLVLWIGERREGCDFEGFGGIDAVVSQLCCYRIKVRYRGEGRKRCYFFGEFVEDV